eukprot:5518983-Alexandrium_andersonii.AAC.1
MRSGDGGKRRRRHGSAACKRNEPEANSARPEPRRAPRAQTRCGQQAPEQEVRGGNGRSRGRDRAKETANGPPSRRKRGRE